MKTKLLLPILVIAVVIGACKKSNSSSSNNSSTDKSPVQGVWADDHNILITKQGGVYLDSSYIPGSGVTYNFINDSTVVINAPVIGSNPASSDTIPYTIQDSSSFVLGGTAYAITTLTKSSFIYYSFVGDSSTVFTRVTYYLTK
jgi:hypothetical protein